MVSVPANKLKKIHRDLDACQKVIWLRGGVDPAYCKDAQDSLKDIDALLAQPAAQHQGEPVAVLYRDGSVLTKADCGDAFETCCKVETPLYANADTGEVERLRAALKFYADRDHFSDDMGSDWDNVSGEPANILWHEDEAWFVEDGSIARAALCASTAPAPASDGFSAEQMTAQGADGYRNGIKAAAELTEAYPELAQAIRALPLPQ
ncbi:hypothetical protein PspR32_12245 [Pseudomonas sp. R32]|nr:hypothetical protein PspR32_12245 [Pseudomonas sp. R32]